MIVGDWRSVSAFETAPLYRSEVARWDALLHWDTRANWRLVEAARASGTLPGVIARDENGAIQGWAFYLLHHGMLQIGALVASSPAATSAVLDAILESRGAAAAWGVQLFTVADARGLSGELQRRGFITERYRYLQRSLSDWPMTGRAGRGWQIDDHLSVAALLSRAYAARDPARPFVRSGRAEEWIEYVQQLVTTRGCGVFLPDATVIAESPAGIDAAVLATRLGPGTAHLAQVVVDPLAQRAGRGRLIVSAVLSNLREAAYERVTLLVSSANGRAARLDQTLGFADAGVFLSAARDQPRRSKREALETGGARTFR